MFFGTQIANYFSPRIFNRISADVAIIAVQRATADEGASEGARGELAEVERAETLRPQHGDAVRTGKDLYFSPSKKPFRKQVMKLQTTALDKIMGGVQ